MNLRDSLIHLRNNPGSRVVNDYFPTKLVLSIQNGEVTHNLGRMSEADALILLLEKDYGYVLGGQPIVKANAQSDLNPVSQWIGKIFRSTPK